MAQIVVKDGSKITMDMISSFKSTGLTGTGASMSIAHGLGRVPNLVAYALTTNLGSTACTISEGTHDSTNLQLSVTSPAKFMVVAW